MKRNADNKKASQVFIGRVEHIDDFMKKYNAVYDSVKTDNTCGEPVVFAYNGAGGIGKSTLIGQLNKRIVEANEAKKRKTFFVKVDFDNKTDTCEILQDIADQLRKEYRFRLPSFSSALTEYKIARGDNVDDCIDTLMDSPLLELVNFFSGGILSNGLHVLNNLHKLIKEARNSAIAEEQGDKLRELKGALPFQLGSDISANLEKRGGVLVIALDTYEKLVNTLEGKKTSLNDMWLQDTRGLIRCCKNTIWIIGGREPLGWDTKKWSSDKLIQTDIKPFSEAEGMKYLESLGVDDADICNKIYEVTGGAPFFMKLCAEVYEQHKAYNDLTDDMFDISFDKLYERFVRYMNEDQMSVVSVMACLGRWNDELLKAIGGELIPEVPPSTYDVVGGLTVVDRNENGISVLQKDCQKALCDRCDSRLKSAVHKAAVELCGEKLTGGSKLSAEEYELYSSLYKLHGAALYGEDFGLTQSELMKNHLSSEINKINSRLCEDGISADERAELLLYLTKLYNEMYIYVDADEHYLEEMTAAADEFLSVTADEECSKADLLKINLANMLAEALPHKALQLYDEVYDRLNEILNGHNESVATVMIQRLGLINGASIFDNRKCLERSADKVTEAYKDIVEFYDSCGDEAAVCKWYRSLCAYIKSLSAEYYSPVLDFGDKLVGYRRKRNIFCEDLAAALLDMYDSYARTDIYSLELAKLAYEKSKENRAYISGFDADCSHCRRTSAVGKIYSNNGDHENALIYYAEELIEKVKVLIKHYNDLFEAFKGGDYMAVLNEMTDEQIKSLSSELFCLPSSGREISALAEKCGRYDLALPALEKGYAFSQKAYKLCRFWHKNGVMLIPPQFAVEIFSEKLADAYRNTGNTNAMIYVMEDMYRFTKVVMDSSDDEIASAANSIAWQYFECGRSERAEQYIAEALKCADKTTDDYHYYVDSAAYIYADIGKHDIAMRCAEELMTLALERQKKYPESGTNEFRIAEAKVTMAYCHAKAGDKDKAEKILSEALVVLEKLSGQPIKGLESIAAVYDDDALQRARKLKQELADMVVSSAQQPHSYVPPKTAHEKCTPNDKKYTEYDYDSLGDEEVDRLCIQQRITERMDLPVLQRISGKYKAPVVIDLGCNQGDLGMARFSSLEYGLYLGIDHSAAAIETAEKKYGSSRNKYYCADGCDERFVEKVRAQLRNNGADGADIIFVSMMLLHCKEQESTLKKLHELLRDGGTIFIRDIDDRDNFAFPDPDGIFEKAFELVKCNTMGGDRHCGRKIGGLLRRAGYKNVAQEMCGLSTVGMNDDERMALYHTYFDFQIPDAYTCLEAAPNDAATLQRFGWWVYNIPLIEDLFRRNEVEFTLGFVVYTAEK